MNTTALSYVSTWVERISTLRTTPRMPPTSTTSPSRMIRPKMTMRPLVKFWTMFCMPKPTPTLRPPATTVRLVRLKPQAAQNVKDEKGPEGIGICGLKGTYKTGVQRHSLAAQAVHEGFAHGNEGAGQIEGDEDAHYLHGVE